jgi:integrase
MSARRDKRNGRWYFRKMIRLPDGRKERIFGVPTTLGLPDTKLGAEEAERREIHRVTTTGEVKPPPPPPEPKEEIPTIKEFAIWFLEASRVSNKPSSVRSKEIYFRCHIVPRLGSLRLDQVTYREIEDFKIHLATTVSRGSSHARTPGHLLKPKSVNNILLTLHRMLVLAKKRALIASVPEFEWLRSAPPDFDFFTVEESERLIAAGRGECGVMFTLALRTGLRRGELLGLRWQDVDLATGKLVVRQNIVSGVTGTPKSGKAREVPLTKAMVARLKAHRHLRGPLVFCTASGHPLHPTPTLRELANTCQRAGLRRVGWHVMRHTFASQLAMRNVPLKAIQEMLGHATIQMTMRYAHLAPGVTQSAVDLLESPGVAAGWQQAAENCVNN